MRILISNPLGNFLQFKLPIALLYPYLLYMDVFVVDISAFWLWFIDQSAIRAANPVPSVPEFANATVRADQLPEQELAALGFHRPIHLAVPTRSARRPSSSLICHLFSSPPPYSFVRVSPHVYVEAPIPTLVRMAPRLPTGTLARLLNRLLAAYQIKNGDIIKRQPLATKYELERFMWRTYGIRGIKSVQRLLPYLVENLASPEEVRLAALLFLPPQLGGQGLPLASANAPIRTIGTSMSTMRYADLFWQLWKLILEYDSDLHHSSDNDIGRDSARRAQLQAGGYHVVTMTRHQLHDPAAFRDTVLALKHAMGNLVIPGKESLPLTSFTPEETQLRRELYSTNLAQVLGL